MPEVSCSFLTASCPTANFSPRNVPNAPAPETRVNHFLTRCVNNWFAPASLNGRQVNKSDSIESLGASF